MCNHLFKQFCFGMLIIAILTSTSFGEITKEDMKIPEADNIQIITLNDGSTLAGRITKIIHRNKKAIHGIINKISISMNKTCI